MRRRSWLAVAVALTGLLVALTVVPDGAGASSTIFGTRTPATATVNDRFPVELGVLFVADVDGTLTAVRFYKDARNLGPHLAKVWSRGQLLATAAFPAESATGWQTAKLDRPVKITAGRTYVASYVAPTGRYASDYNGFDAPVTSGHITVPAGGGVFSYSIGQVPNQTYKNSNYWVDVEFQAGDGTAPTSNPSATASPSTSSSSSASATNAPPPSVTASPTDLPDGDAPAQLSLSRIPWEGGADYYKKFPRSGQFARDDFFPIGAWWADFDTDSNVKFDKDKGINFYVQLNGREDGRLLSRNSMAWVGSQPLPNMTNDDPAWNGWWLSDETDGRYDPPSSGQAEVQKEIDAQQATRPAQTPFCRFAYANYTATITAQHNPTQIAAAEKYVNMYDGPVSVDGYYYTDPSCDDPQHIDYQTNAPKKGYCRRAANYGNLINTLRIRDAADGKLKPLWGFLENGAPTSSGVYIEPDQMKAGAWNMIINEARGLVWFNQSFSGDCQSGNVIRQAEAQPDGCNIQRVQAMKEVNAQIQSFAPVLNTQSYAWTFGTGLDTMLKYKDGSAYVFSMIEMNSDPGARTFTLPAELADVSSVEVVGENRTIGVSGGKFRDNYGAESTVHIYKIDLG